ncbi:MAG TPA: hypothetical protein VHK70_10560 [Burkholderiaceae bacterium]|jgi:hypothetical protein|nr:hypothetical protein [Burkholderiaceae bacterium]
MDFQNLAYALAQIVHNFGAVLVVGAAAAALWLVPRQSTHERSLAWLVLLGWMAQIISGAGLGAISYYYYGRFPDITGVATVALVLKVASAGLGSLLAALYLLRAARWSDATRQRIWRTLTGLGVLALTAAAFLRWFS